jgi:hypothetical protein
MSKNHREGTCVHKQINAKVFDLHEAQKINKINRNLGEEKNRNFVDLSVLDQ